MKKNAKKTLSFLLTLCMLYSSTVPMNAAETYNIDVVPGHYTINLDKTTVEAGGDFSFTVDLDDAYSQSTFRAFSNEYEVSPDSSGLYTVTDVNSDQTIVLYNLQKNQYTVTFMLPDGSMTRTNGVEHGKRMVPADYPEVPARDGYTVKWDKTNPEITGNTTITGTYVPISNTYSITYDLNGGSWDTGVSVPMQYDGSAIVSIPNPTKAGATFLGWVGTNLTSAAKDVTIAAGASGNRTYTAVWSNVNASYSVSFDMNGHGTQISNITGISYGSIISVPQAPTADGYVFGGWYQDEACTSPWNFASNLVTKDTTLYAKWTAADASGDAGSSGDDGNAGNTGNSGNTGDAGNSGNTGNNGDTGNAGNNGNGGNTGSTGNNGNANTPGSGDTSEDKDDDKNDKDDDEYEEWSETEINGVIKTETDVEVTIKDGVITTITTEKETNIRTGKTTETVTTVIEDEDNGVESVVIVEEDEDGDVEVIADTYIYGFYDEDDDDEDELTKLTIKNETDEDIKTLVMDTKKADLDDAKNILEDVLKDGKSVKYEADLADDDKWYFRAFDEDDDTILTDYVTFDDAEDCKSATIILGEDSIEIEKEVEWGKDKSDVSFDFDDDRTEAIADQLDEAYDIAMDADRDAEVNATFYATMEDAESTELCLPTELVEALADSTNGHIYVETLDCTLSFPTVPTWQNLEREVRKELVIFTETNGDAVTVEVKDNKTPLDNFGPYTITFPYDGTMTANIVGYILSGSGDKNGELVQKSYNVGDCVVIPVTGSAVVTAKSNAKSFMDNNSVWNVDAIRFVTARNIFYGTSEGVFSPNVGMNRAMIVQILYKLEGAPVTSGTQHFADVPAEHWAFNAVNWAKENNIVDGVGNGYFNPNDLITREQLTKILFTYENFLGIDTSERADIGVYSDVYDSPNWAKDAMSFAVAEGLIYGDGNNTLNPKGIVTRGQMAVVLQRVIEGIN